MLSPPKTTLQVFDMGLDFRSYLSRVDDNGLPILGNVISYDATKLNELFEPTVGLLVTILHMIAQCTSNATAVIWLQAYDSIQRMYIECARDESVDLVQYAIEARAAIGSSLADDSLTDTNVLCEKLLMLLDQQSGIHGSQAPSQRKVPRDPKGAFCNLHLSDQKCFQDFACNQLHLQDAGPVHHRVNFFMRLIQVLKAESRSRVQIQHRIRDSIFFARYGNKVTVQCHGKWIPFFKTVYTDGRLEQAFRIHQFACNNSGCNNESCKGVHPQDRRGIVSSKQMDIHNLRLVAQQIEDEAEQLLVMEEKYSNQETEPLNIHTHRPSIPSLTSPTSDLWRDTVREYVRQTGIPQIQADESLLRTLQDANFLETPAPSTESLTPLLDELDMHAFSTNGSPRDSPHS
ncbi:hypothetical protein TRVL_09073 [Trypanosoma vivax]|nr:hypothetical protein TRVL_09073 [Trypanosoma vivax]